MSILKFRTSEEVIRRANASPFGLGAGVISRDIGTALSMAHRLRAGTVYVVSGVSVIASPGFSPGVFRSTTCVLRVVGEPVDRHTDTHFARAIRRIRTMFLTPLCHLVGLSSQATAESWANMA